MIDSKFFDKKFDLIVSLGEDCACSSYLRRFNLQDYTYPFDWLTRASFTTRIDLLCNNFEKFLVKENIVRLGFPYNTRQNTDEEEYEDTFLKFNFYHDFNKKLTFEENFQQVKARYNRRIDRFYKISEVSNKILFVWWDRSKNIEENDIIESYKKLSSKFSKNEVYLLIIEFSEHESSTCLEDGNIFIARYDNLTYNNPNWNETMGNEANNIKIFKKIRMYRSFYCRLKYILFKLIKIFVELIPIKETRSKLRKKLRYYFFRAKL